MGVFVPVWLVLPRCEATNLGVFDECRPTQTGLCKFEWVWSSLYNTPPVLGGAAVLTIQSQRCIKLGVLRAQDFHIYTSQALNWQEEQHLPALEVYKNQSPTFCQSRVYGGRHSTNQMSLGCRTVCVHLGAPGSFTPSPGVALLVAPLFWWLRNQRKITLKKYLKPG